MSILVTGGSGMVGQNLKKFLPDAQYISSKDVDLTNQSATYEFFSSHKPTKVIHLAAKVGGIKDNNDHPYEFFTKNLLINTNVVHACLKFNIPKLIALSSTCVYPAHATTYPMTESMVHDSPPEQTNLAYAYAKRAMDIQIQVAKREDWAVIYPNNLYGPHDHFNSQLAHVIPSLFRKIHNTSQNGIVDLFGTGKALRQFTYVEDIARFLSEIIEKPLSGQYNFGNERNVKIEDLFWIISSVMNRKDVDLRFTGELEGQIRKDVTDKKLQQIYEFEYTSLRKGLEKTYEWLLMASND